MPAAPGSVGILGLGYVGGDLAAALGAAGLRVVGYDPHAPAVAAAREAGVDAHGDPGPLDGLDAYLIAVPTPLGRDGTPDTSALVSAAGTVAAAMPDGALVVVESTVWPGATRERVLPVLVATGKRFKLAMSPERVDPGTPGRGVADIPKVVGGLDEEAGAAAAALYEAIPVPVHRVSSLEAAELSKMVENAFRAVNIAFVNQVKQAAVAMGVDVWEALEAAATKPFGFMPFTPGPGVGGHCIPVDPAYLSWAAERAGQPIPILQATLAANAAVPRWVVDQALTHLGDPPTGRALLLGVAFKPGIGDVRESPALAMAARFAERGWEVAAADPHVAPQAVGMTLVPLEGLDPAAWDVVVLVTDHKEFDLPAIAAASQCFVDTRGRTRGLEGAPVIHL